MERALTPEAGAVVAAGWGRRLWVMLRSLAGESSGDELTAQTLLARENARLREELRRSREAIERAGRLSSLGMLAASIAHEIRNPLVSVQTFFQLAPERWHDEEFAGAFRELTESEVVRIQDLVNELLTIARAPGREMDEIDLGDFAQQTVRLLAPQARQRQVRLVCSVEGDAPRVTASPDQVKQVLLNLLLNAVEATAPSGTVSVLIRGVRRDGRSFGQVEIRDAGNGIPAEVQDDIFQPFFTTKAGGTGLGLSIARDIVAAHGGFISVESADSQGTCFSVHFPTEPTKRAAAGAAA